MVLHPAQKAIATDLHRFRVVNCGRRTGKTTLAILEMVAKAVYKNDTRVCYIAPTYQQARDIAWQELKKIAMPASYSINESRLEITIKTADGGKAYISLRGWESIETLRGQKYDFIVIDEIASMRNWWVNWEEVIRPTLTDREGSVLFISTPKGFNHFYELYNMQDDPIKGKDYKSFHFTTYDNPHIKPEEIEKARLEMTEDRFAQEYLGDFRKTEGLVYKEFDRTRHVYSTAVYASAERLVGIDWGFTNPAAVYLIERDSDANYWITDEYYKPGKTTDDICEYAASLRGNKYYPDPAEPDRIEVLKRKHVNVMEVSKDIEAGIDSVRELFKANRLHIHSSCVNLITELELYHYPEKKPDKNEPELPVKEDDHAMDAIRYVLFMQQPIQGTRRAVVTYPSNNIPTNGFTTPTAPGAPKRASVRYPTR